MDRDVDVTIENERLSKVERDSQETRQEVAGMKAELHSVGAGMRRIEEILSNKQPTWNTTTVLALVLSVGGGMYTLNSYIGLELSPVMGHIQELKDREVAVSEFERETGYAFGVLTTEQKYTNERLNRIDTLKEGL